MLRVIYTNRQLVAFLVTAAIKWAAILSLVVLVIWLLLTGAFII